MMSISNHVYCYAHIHTKIRKEDENSSLINLVKLLDLVVCWRKTQEEKIAFVTDLKTNTTVVVEILRKREENRCNNQIFKVGRKENIFPSLPLASVSSGGYYQDAGKARIGGEKV